MTNTPPPVSGIYGDDGLHRYALRAYYEDTDLSGYVYHANYIRWCERARSDMLRLLGIDQRTAVEDGTGVYTIAEVNVRYHAPIKLDDDVMIVSRVADLGAATSLMEQKVMRLDGKDTVLAATAMVKAAFIGMDGIPRRHPPKWSAAFQSVLDNQKPDQHR
jgi:acyl-CoA thioester hydrolase